jgi:multidrug efflux pump subunit AcrA (membrane-fusion protein)
VAAQLGIAGSSAAAPSADTLRPLQALTASRSQRESEATAAAQAQSLADQAKLAALAAAAQAQAQAEAAAAKAVADKAVADKAAADAAAAQQQQAAAARPSGSFPSYALGKLGGNASQFSCLQSLWGKESGWNPNARNPSSTAYGIAQFLDSTWAGTGIAKTSDGYRQIDAGLIYIDRAYGSPCGAWAHSRALNWY